MKNVSSLLFIPLSGIPCEQTAQAAREPHFVYGEVFHHLRSQRKEWLEAQNKFVL